MPTRSARHRRRWELGCTVPQDVSQAHAHGETLPEAKGRDAPLPDATRQDGRLHERVQGLPQDRRVRADWALPSRAVRQAVGGAGDRREAEEPACLRGLQGLASHPRQPTDALHASDRAPGLPRRARGADDRRGDGAVRRRLCEEARRGGVPRPRQADRREVR